MKKVLIIGNSGSGKSWLSARLAKQLNAKEVNLDSIFWEPGGFNKKRSPEDVASRLGELCSEPAWVVEGVFGALAEKLNPAADTLIFLDIAWDVCERSLLLRGSESSRQLDPAAAEKNFKELLRWAAKYKIRASKSSFRFHAQLFEQFTGDKFRFTNREEVNDFAAALARQQDGREGRMLPPQARLR